MKKIIFLIIAIILSACLSPSGGSPQVTSPTQTSEVSQTSEVLTATPIPSPTLHPDFISLQNFIHDASARITLLPDGTIEEATTDGGRQTVPNLHVDQNGIININFNNEHVVIEQSQITFDDENGLAIEGYELDEVTGQWVEAESAAMQTFQSDFEKYGVAIDQYDVTESDGNLMVTNPETGEIVYKNGSFEPLFLGQLIVENNMCRQTEWTGSKIGAVNPSGIDLKPHLDQYLNPLGKDMRIFVNSRLIHNPGGRAKNYYLGDNCWGVVFYGKPDQSNAWFFWKNPNGKSLYQQVFLTPKE